MPADSMLLQTSSPDRQSQTELAYRDLKRLILDGVLPPGSQLLEQEGAMRLGMSRTPVREAMVRLQQEGLVEIRPRHGMRVLPVMAEDVREIHEVVTALESTAVAAIARRGLDPDALAALREAIAGMDTALDANDLPAWAAFDDRFHALLAHYSGNRRMGQILTQLAELTRRARMLTLHVRPPPHASNRAHEAVIDAIEARDPERARSIHQEHRKQGGVRIVDLLRKLGGSTQL